MTKAPKLTDLCHAQLEPDEPGDDGYTDVLVADGGLYPRYQPGEVAIVETGVPPAIGEDAYLTMKNGGTALVRLIAAEVDSLLLANVNDHHSREYVKQCDIATMERVEGRISPPPSLESRSMTSGAHARPTLH